MYISLLKISSPFKSIYNKSCSMSNMKFYMRIAGDSIPQLCNERHKGQAGRIGVIGGSLEYTGAPYFAAISALKVGADLVHIFCPRDAAPVIKSYSPELIVHPLLDSEQAVSAISPWLDRLHVIILGPGLGRDPNIFKTVAGIVKKCRALNLPLVIDADGLQWAKEYSSEICNYHNVILTPNVAEFKRLFGNEDEVFDAAKKLFGSEVVIMQKGFEDVVYDVKLNSKILIGQGGSGRRCGGQGDLLSGAIGIFFHWTLQYSKDKNCENDINLPAKAACTAASSLTKLCNEEAFKEFGRSMSCSDMINMISRVFRREFEHAG